VSAPNPIAAGGSPQLAHAHRNGLGETAGNRDFHALMDSLAEKDVAPKKADGGASSSLSASKSNTSGFPTPIPSLKNESAVFEQASVAVYDPRAQTILLNANRDAVVVSGGESNSTNRLGPELESLLSPDAQSADAVLELAQGRGARTPAASPAMVSNHEDSISAAFSSVADAMQLHVTRATSHFDSAPVVVGQDASQPKTMAITSLDPGGEEPTEASLAKSIDVAAAHSPGDAPSQRDAGPASSNASVGSPALTFGDVPLPLVPQTLSEAVDALRAALAQPTSAGSSPAGAAARPVGAMTRELEIQLSPSGLGSLLVKMKLTGGALSVVIEASKPATLNAVESARETIVDRLAATNQLAASLVVKPLHVSQNLSEDTNASSGGPAMGNDSRGQSDAGGRPPDRRGSREEYRAPDQCALGGAHDYVL
jgi:flagellar hook-length control protein FliK